MPETPVTSTCGLSSIPSSLGITVEIIQDRHDQRDANAVDDQYFPVATGVKGLDALSPCLWQGEVTVLTGPPGIGKTSLICQIATHAAIDLKRAVAFYTLGESRLRALRYMLASFASLSYDRLLSGRMDENYWDRLTVTLGDFHDAPIFMSDASLTTETLYEQVSGPWHSLDKQQPQMLVIDNFESIVSGVHGADRCARIANAMRTLRELAVESAMPVLLVSQWGSFHENNSSTADGYDAIEQRIIQTQSHTHLALQPSDLDTASERDVTATLRRGGQRETTQLTFIGEVRHFVDGK